MEPQIENLTYGVEIECLVPDALGGTTLAARITEAGIECQFELYNHARRPGWKIVTDDSLRSSPTHGGLELVSPVLQGDAGFEQIQTVSRVLLANDIRVNRSCGLHVHVGAAGRQLPWFKNLLRLYAQFEPVIDSVLAPSRRGAVNRYCAPVRYNSTMDEATTTNQLRRAYGLNRYRKLNLEAFSRHGTVEFRAHQGTIEAEKIINWTIFCLKLAAAADEPSPPIQGGIPALGDDRLITMLVTRNPRRPGSATWYRFERYETGITVREALARGITRKDLQWDVEHGFIRIGDVAQTQGEITTDLAGLMRLVKASDAENNYFNERATALARR